MSSGVSALVPNGCCCAMGHLQTCEHAEEHACRFNSWQWINAHVFAQVCRARGMRAPFGEGAAPFMRRQLKEWLDLSLNR